MPESEGKKIDEREIERKQNRKTPWSEFASELY
jgi:hypothetical protein